VRRRGVLNAIYEKPSSVLLRVSAWTGTTDALDALDVGIKQPEGELILDADIRSFFVPGTSPTLAGSHEPAGDRPTMSSTAYAGC